MKLLQHVSCIALFLVALAMSGSAIRPKFTPILPVGDWTKLPPPGEGDDSSRIINGQEAEPHSLPFVVGLFMAGGSFCTASLISDQWVLTAGHCQSGAAIIYTDVHLGAHNINNAGEHTVVRATEKHVHPDYNANTLRGDIALVRLPGPTELTQNIQPIRLGPIGDENLYEGERVRIAGWGKTSAIGGISPTLQTSEVVVITNAECRVSFGVIIQDWTLCTSFNATGSGTCNGDSGSSLSIFKDGAYEQIGVTSFVASRICGIGEPDGYTRLSYYRQWVKDTSGI